MALSMSYQEVQSLILFLFAALFLTGLLAQAINTASVQSTREACELSVTTRLFGEEATGGWANPFTINCARRVISLYSPPSIFAAELSDDVTGNEDYRISQASYVEVDGQEQKYPRRIVPNTTKESLTEVFAYEMGLCWELFSEGRGDILDSKSSVVSMASCVVCAEIYVPELENGYRINVEEYMRNQEHPFYHSLDTPTYADYLRTNTDPSNAASCKEDAFASENLEVQGLDSYLVVFKRDGSGADWITGDSCQTVDVVATRNVREVCDVVVN